MNLVNNSLSVAAGFSPRILCPIEVCTLVLKHVEGTSLILVCIEFCTLGWYNTLNMLMVLVTREFVGLY